MARRNRPRSRSSGDPAAWTRAVLVVGLLAVGAWVWLEVLSVRPQPASTGVAPTRPTPPPAAQPSSPPAAQPAPRNPVISVRPLEEPKPEPQAAPESPPPSQTPSPAGPVEPSNPPPEPSPPSAQPPVSTPQLTYVPEADPTPGPASPMVNPTPNTRVKIAGRPDGLILRRAPATASDRLIALTFDDGPSPEFTPQVLETLARYGVRATFFWVGQELDRNPDVARAVLAAGHAAGNHTWTHRTAPADDLQAQRELQSTQQLLEAVGGSGRLFRPPGGRLNNGLADWALREGYTVVMWSAQSNDWEPSVGSQQIVENVLGAARPGAIVLLHDGGGNRARTVAALPAILEGLQAQGYRFVTIPEMLATIPVQQ
ncbi:MAG: polysaccharide deacetylase family protein [Meiothermus sp.]|nr:polysaccharide deacetylase family protein [Meiothermus sp.]